VRIEVVCLQLEKDVLVRRTACILFLMTHLRMHSVLHSSGFVIGSWVGILLLDSLGFYCFGSIDISRLFDVQFEAAMGALLRTFERDKASVGLVVGDACGLGFLKARNLRFDWHDTHLAGSLRLLVWLHFGKDILGQ